MTDPIADFSLGMPPDSTVSRRVDTYSLLNLRSGFIFRRRTSPADSLREGEISISVFNALNDRHKQHSVGDTIGNHVMGWLTLKL